MAPGSAVVVSRGSDDLTTPTSSTGSALVRRSTPEVPQPTHVRKRDGTAALFSGAVGTLP